MAGGAKVNRGSDWPTLRFPNLIDFASLALGSRDTEASRIDSCLHYDIRMIRLSSWWQLSSLVMRRNVAGCFNWPDLEMGCRNESGRWGKWSRV